RAGAPRAPRGSGARPGTRPERQGPGGGAFTEVSAALDRTLTPALAPIRFPGRRPKSVFPPRARRTGFDLAATLARCRTHSHGIFANARSKAPNCRAPPSRERIYAERTLPTPTS